MESIFDIVQKVIDEYGTRDPFELCECLDIEYDIADIGELQGFFTYIDDYPFIGISSLIDESRQRIACAHELGHYFLHSTIAKENCLKEFEIFNMRDPVEYEANVFAAHFLLDEDELLEHLQSGMTVFQAAMMLGYNVSLLNIKLTEMNGYGYNFDTSWGDHKLFG